MANAPKSYDPVNQCIYCGAQGVPLSKEHLIPYSLNGKHVLPKASCAAHAEITSSLELDFSRTAYGIYRAENGISSRKKKRLAESLSKTVELEGERFDGTKVMVEVPIGKAPPVPVVIRLNAPGILTGAAPDAEGECRMDLPPTPDPRLRALRESLGLKSLYSSVATVPFTNILRVLAKIAHSYAVAELGVNGFRPVLLDLILTGPGSVALWHYIGEHDPPAAQSESELELRYLRIGTEIWVVVDISFHFFPRMPKYQVFVGTVKDGMATS
jgi:hypothetical protein